MWTEKEKKNVHVAMRAVACRGNGLLCRATAESRIIRFFDDCSPNVHICTHTSDSGPRWIQVCVAALMTCRGIWGSLFIPAVRFGLTHNVALEDFFKHVWKQQFIIKGWEWQRMTSGLFVIFRLGSSRKQNKPVWVAWEYFFVDFRCYCTVSTDVAPLCSR